MSAEPVVAVPLEASTPPPSRVAWLQRASVLLSSFAVAEALAILLIAAGGDPRFQVGFNLPTIGFIASIVLFPAVGALIIQRRPSTRVAWLMILIGLSFGTGLLAYGYGTVGTPPASPLIGARESLALAQLFFVPIPAPAIAFLVLLFPTDHLLSARWRIVGALSIVGAVLYSVGTVLRPGVLDTANFPTVANPFGAPAAWAEALDLTATAGNTLVTGSIALGAASLVVRYRRAGSVESAQIRWIALVAALAAASLAVAALQVRGGPADGVSEVAFGVGLVILACMPMAVGVAISRYRLYDIDRLINRALVYGSLTAILAGIFTAAVGLAQRLFVASTGQKSDGAIVLTTLVVATLYAPIRKRLEALVDRRFKYDERRFGAYRNEIRQVLSVVEPGRAVQRLATEAVNELQAIGCAVVDDLGGATASAGVWPAPAVIRMSIHSGDRRGVALVVGPRADGRPHDPIAVAELQEVVSLVAAAIRLRTDAGRNEDPTVLPG